jgi:hypothetical protein
VLPQVSGSCYPSLSLVSARCFALSSPILRLMILLWLVQSVGELTQVPSLVYAADLHLS